MTRVSAHSRRRTPPPRASSLHRTVETRARHSQHASHSVFSLSALGGERTLLIPDSLFPAMFQPPARRTPSPPPQRTLSRHGSSNGSFVCNVSDDEVIERDVDLEIEARIRNNTLPGSDSDSELPLPTRAHRTASTRSMPRRTSSSPPVKSTLSQRMLSALQKKKAQTAGRTKRSGSILLEVVQAENGTIPEMPRAGSNHSMGADIDGLVVPDPFYDPSLDPVYMSDDESQPVTHSVSTSCKDRLEARISDRLLQNKSSLSAQPDSGAPLGEPANHDLSVVYTNRRTYPAESTKKADPRYSDNHLDTRYERAGVTPEQRVNRAAGNYYQQQYGSQQYSNQYAPHHQAPLREQPQAPSYPPHQPQQSLYVNIRGPIEPTLEVLDANKSLPVAFHFQGKSGSAQAGQPRPQPGQHDHHHRASHQQGREQPRRDERDHYTALSLSVDQIEQVVDGLENLVASSSFWSLAMVALRELELLRESIKQVRTNGTTMILAEVGRPQSQMLFRHLVARSAALQNRIEALIHRIRTMS